MSHSQMIFLALMHRLSFDLAVRVYHSLSLAPLYLMFPSYDVKRCYSIIGAIGSTINLRVLSMNMTDFFVMSRGGLFKSLARSNLFRYSDIGCTVLFVTLLYCRLKKSTRSVLMKKDFFSFMPSLFIILFNLS